ncbi:unnamed protein product [Ilex paraguariensis]|uniref:Uncharacterized protein n=1 Tax=Ilex paraguariensis TaxID=185542 RepID=A0ABC8S2Z9_9AQUA
MDSKTSQGRLMKRPMECSDIDRPKKKPTEYVNDDRFERIYMFKVLLPNGTSMGMKMSLLKSEIPIEEFVQMVQQEYFQTIRKTEPSKPRRRINWNSQDLHFVDAFENKIRKKLNFKNFKPNNWYILRLHDGSGEAETFENMWDLTPDTDLLKELPEEYTFETALADLIDNSLQAVWSNGKNEKRLISVDIVEGRISIFDTGRGMDGSHENSIVKWGKMGASLHRSSKGQAIGGKPPYLRPFFGMFGYGGPIASMHLGRRALVSSKTKESKKVYTLHLERDALLSSSSSEQTWRTNGGLRDPLEDEIEKSPNGSFTKVDIFEPKMRFADILQLQCELKDIYFPYIQCDEVSNTGRTVMPIEFQVNGIDLAEIGGGEVAITNLHSCNGPDFVLQLQFCFNQDTASASCPGLRRYQEANARLKCVFFPIVEGKESIERILEKLEVDGCGIPENYENFSHVSIRRLGRLLPDARWAWLPFMDLRQRRGDRAQILKRCCSRVKCFIETDAGFSPTPSKTDLAHHHPYTIALKNFGNKSLEKEKEVNVEIYKDEKPLNLLQLERQYREWIFQMHDRYDEESDTGVDQPVLVVSPLNKKALGVSSDVVRVHKVVQRKGTSWKSGQKIKILKGACPGCHKKNIYATLEYILLDGFQGDAGAIEPEEWNYQLEKQRQKTPSSIEILSAKHCQELEVSEALPADSVVDAGHLPPEQIIAVNLDQKHIAKENFEMTLEIKYYSQNKDLQNVQHIYSVRVAPSSRKAFHGLYIFPLRSKFPKLFQEAGLYIFTFSLKELNIRNCEKRIQVKALSGLGRWGLLSAEQSAPCSVRVGSCFPPFSIAFYDRYDNRISCTCIPEVMAKVIAKRDVLAHVHNLKVHTSSKILRIKDLLIESSELDKIRPSYQATLMICSLDDSLSVQFPCQVLPGSLQSVTTQPPYFRGKLLPGHVIKELVLEMFDAYGNHVKEGEEVQLNVDGFCFQDKTGSMRKADDHGCVDLSGLLKVTKGYGEKVCLSVLSGKEIVFKEEFQTEKRELRVTSRLENVVFEITNSEGDVDESIHNEEKHGQPHTLVIKSESGDLDDSVQYSFRRGRCTIRSLPLPTREGIFCFVAAHSRYPELNLSIEVYVEKTSLVEHESLQSHHSDQGILLPHDSSAFKTPNVKHDDVQHQYSNGKIILIPDSSVPEDVATNLAISIMNDQRELEDDVFRYGLCIGQHEEKLKMFSVQQDTIEQDISMLQGSDCRASGCWLRE